MTPDSVFRIRRSRLLTSLERAETRLERRAHVLDAGERAVLDARIRRLADELLDLNDQVLSSTWFSVTYPLETGKRKTRYVPARSR